MLFKFICNRSPAHSNKTNEKLLGQQQMNIQLQKTTKKKKIDLVKNLIRKVDNIIINYKPIKNLIKSPSKSPLQTAQNIL